MNVRLVSLTKPGTLHPDAITDEPLTPEQLIVFTARVSNPGNQHNTATADKLIAYLIKNKHWSPFEMVDMTVEIKTSRAIAQQILRHRSFSFQEFSQRYAEVAETEPVQLRKQADKNRQSSTEAFDPAIRMENSVESWNASAMNAVEQHLEASQKLYKALLEAGVAKSVHVWCCRSPRRPPFT